MKKYFEDSEYQVDTEGNIYGKNNNILKYSVNHNGYAIVNLMINGKRKGYSVHTLVAKTFIPNPNNLPTVNHIDGNKLNNSISNLEWKSYKEQMKHAIEKLGFEYDKNMKKKLIAKSEIEEYKFNSLSEASSFFSNKYNIKYKSVKLSIWRVLNGNRNSYKGFTFKYI